MVFFWYPRPLSRLEMAGHGVLDGQTGQNRGADQKSPECLPDPAEVAMTQPHITVTPA